MARRHRIARRMKRAATHPVTRECASALMPIVAPLVKRQVATRAACLATAPFIGPDAPALLAVGATVGPYVARSINGYVQANEVPSQA